MMIGADGSAAVRWLGGKLLRNPAAAVLAFGLVCNFSCWTQQAVTNELPLV
jgi:hypothetical protein